MDNFKNNNPKMEFAMPFIRQGKFPLDATSLFKSKADAINYVNTDPTAYTGQVISVLDAVTKTVELNVIGYSGALISASAIVSSNVDGKSIQLNNGKLELFAFDTLVKGGMSIKSKADGEGGFVLEWFDIDKSFSDITKEIDNIKLELAKKLDKDSYLSIEEAQAIIDKYRKGKKVKEVKINE